MWLAPVTNKLTLTSFPHFVAAAQVRGAPDQLVTDKGTENYLPAFCCNVIQEALPREVSSRSSSPSLTSVFQ